MADRDTIELRVNVPRDLMEGFDMCALARGQDRSALTLWIIRRYVVARQHEASLIAKSPRITPASPDSGWGALE